MIYKNKSDIDEWLERTDIPLFFVLKTGFPTSPKCHARVIDERGRSVLTIVSHNKYGIRFKKAYLFESDSEKVNSNLVYLLKCHSRTAQHIRNGDVVSVLILDSKHKDDMELHVGVVGKVNLMNDVPARLQD